MSFYSEQDAFDERDEAQSPEERIAHLNGVLTHVNYVVDAIRDERDEAREWAAIHNRDKDMHYSRALAAEAALAEARENVAALIRQREAAWKERDGLRSLEASSAARAFESECRLAEVESALAEAQRDRDEVLAERVRAGTRADVNLQRAEEAESALAEARAESVEWRTSYARVCAEVAASREEAERLRGALVEERAKK